MWLLVVFVACGFCGIVQGVTGFGAGIILMSIFPFFIDIIHAGALINLIAITLMARVFWEYRKDVNWRLIIIPVAIYMVTSITALTFAQGLETRILQMAFGIFLIVISLYFTLFNNKIRLKKSNIALVLCGLMAGLCDGMFGVGNGPIYVLYFLSVCETREEYMGTLQGCMIVGVIYLTIVKMFKGIITTQLFLPALIGIVGIQLGLVISKKVGEHLNDGIIRKLTYALIGISGMITFVNAL